MRIAQNLGCIVEISALRKRTEGNEATGSERVGDQAGNDHLGLDLLQMGHGFG